MGPQAAALFTLGDLAVFDAAHLRVVISGRSGAVDPALAGRAFALTPDTPLEPALDRLSERIERALVGAERATFAAARRQPVTTAARDWAARGVVRQLFWDLTYWKTPEEYDRLTAGEQVHLGALDLARVDGAVALDAGAGCGRVTLPLARRAARVYALDPAPPMLGLLERKLAAAGARNVEPVRGYFQRTDLPDASVDAVVACSAFGPLEACGGLSGLAELKRVTRPGGRIVILWPEDPAWFIQQGFRYATLPGRLTNTFASMASARAVASRFYGPGALRYLETARRPELPFHILGVKEPRDVCWLTLPA